MTVFLDRQLMVRGVATGVEELLSHMTAEERANFEELCDEFDVHNTKQMEQSAFRGKSGKQ